MRHKMILSTTLAASLLLSVPAIAANGNAQSLIQSNGCSSCHAESQKVVGPAWGWIAYRYKGKKHAVSSVANFIINGGLGYWKKWTGGVPMPSHPNLTKAQARTIAKWILSRQPVKPPSE